jgi:ABC-type branched-subunit amino acid transport system substrate-binding protein
MARPSVRPYRRWSAVFAIFAVLAVLVTACSSSKKTTTGSSSSGGSSSASNLGPIKIGLGSIVIPGKYDSETQFLAGYKAVQGYISENGGWGGRTVKLEKCSSPGDPASDLKCYHQFIDAGTVAVTGLMASSATYLPLLVAAHIPSFVFAGTPAELQNPWSVSLPGAIETFTAAARYACAKGLKNVTVFAQDLPSSRSAASAFSTGIYASCGITVQNVYMPLATADPAPYIQQAVKGNPQLLFIGGQTLPITTFLNAITAAGYPVSQVMTAPTSVPGWLDNPKANGLLIMSRSGYPATQSTDPDIQTFLQYMGKYSPGADITSTLSLATFQNIMMIWGTGKAIGFDKLTGQAIYDYMNNVAPGKLKVFAGYNTVTIPAGYVGVKSPYQRIVQWNGSQFIDKGWFAGDWACTSATTCASLSPPAGSKP